MYLVLLLLRCRRPPHLIFCQAVLFRSLSVLDHVRVGDVVAVSSPPLPLEACCCPPYGPSQKREANDQPALGIRRIAAVAGDELVASDNGEIMIVPPGCVWLTCDDASGDIAMRIDSRTIGPVSVYDVAGRALSLVAPAAANPTALGNNSESRLEDSEWNR